MAEKYKIYLPQEMKNRLLEDAGLFEFRKHGQSVNLNAFLKVLITNYFEEYQKREKEINDGMLSVLTKDCGITEYMAEDAVFRIRSLMSGDADRQENSTWVTLTANDRTERVIRILEQGFLSRTSLSGYFRRMFSDYLSIPRSGREKIIFQEACQEIASAVEGRQTLSFTMSTVPGLYFNVYPYKLVPSRQEQFNYLLCYRPDISKAATFRLTRMQNVFAGTDHFTMPEKAKGALDMAERHAPQFIFEGLEETCVVLTDAGIRKFGMVYTNRPDVLRKDGNRYYFLWPRIPLEEFFRKFGKDAVIVSPEHSRQTMERFYEDAVRGYRETQAPEPL